MLVADRGPVPESRVVEVTRAAYGGRLYLSDKGMVILKRYNGNTRAERATREALSRGWIELKNTSWYSATEAGLAAVGIEY